MKIMATVMTGSEIRVAKYDLRGRCDEEVCEYAGEYWSLIESDILISVLQGWETD